MLKFNYIFISVSFISFQSYAIQHNLYFSSINEYCKQFVEIMPMNECIFKFESNAMEKGLTIATEENAFKKAKSRVFEDGTFKISPNRKEYRFIEQKVSPSTNSPYVESVHHVFYLDENMQDLQHLSLNYRHGQYSGKNIQHEIVHIARNQAKLTKITEPVYWEPAYPDFTLRPVDIQGFTLYRYQLETFQENVTDNYSANHYESGTNGEWVHGEGHRESILQKGRMSGSFTPETDMQFGYEVYLLIKFNPNGFVEIASPAKSKEGYLTITNITKLELSKNQEDALKNAIDNHQTPSIPTLNEKPTQEDNQLDGWYQHYAGLDPLSLNDSDWRKHLATANVNGAPRFICRFTHDAYDQSQILFGVVTMQNENEFVCSGGQQIKILNENGELVPFSSPTNQFEWLSLQVPDLSRYFVEAKDGKQLCSLNNPQFYGVGYLNYQGECVQDENIYWSNGKPWKFKQNWIDYFYK